MAIRITIRVSEGQNLGACSLCMSDFYKDDWVSSLTSCKVDHCFHTVCAQRWSVHNRSCLNCTGGEDPYTEEDLIAIALETPATNSNTVDIPPDPEKEAVKKPMSASVAPVQVAAQPPAAPPHTPQLSPAALNFLKMQRGPWKQK